MSLSETAPCEIVHVDLGDRGYDIVVGSGLLAEAGTLIGPLLPRPRTVIVSDERVAAHHLASLRAGLSAAGIASDAIVLAPGEQSKCFPVLEQLLEDLLAAKVERRDMVIALGGGVIGDLTGFAASILRRGIDFIQVPTTLLAQVDSSVGGKTGINSRHGKNLIGSFHQPRLVLADSDTLATLPLRDRRAGYAEVVKYGLINDAAFFDWLETAGPAVVTDPSSAALRRAVVTSCRAKAEIVGEDERETGRRALLNLGHTFGHALEAETGFGGALLHGEAVAIGMMLAFELSERLGLCPSADVARLSAHLHAVGLPQRIGDIAQALPTEALLGHMAQDKKVQAGKITFVLTYGIGRAFLSDNVPVDALRATLDASRAAR